MYRWAIFQENDVNIIKYFFIKKGAEYVGLRTVVLQVRMALEGS